MIETLDSAYNACDKLNNFEKKDKKESTEKVWLVYLFDR